MIIYKETQLKGFKMSKKNPILNVFGLCLIIGGLIGFIVHPPTIIAILYFAITMVYYILRVSEVI